MNLLVPVLVVAAIGVLVTAVFALVRRNGGDHPSPDNPSAGHDDGVPDPPRAGYDRGAGPAAEATNAPEPGDPSPGESAPQDAGAEDAAPPSAAKGDENPR